MCRSVFRPLSDNLLCRDHGRAMQSQKIQRRLAVSLPLTVGSLRKMREPFVNPRPVGRKCRVREFVHERDLQELRVGVTQGRQKHCAAFERGGARIE